MEQLTVKQLLQGMADAVTPESDRLLTEDEMHDLHAFCETQTEENFSIAAYLGGLGDVMDHFNPGITITQYLTCLWIKSWW